MKFSKKNTVFKNPKKNIYGSPGKGKETISPDKTGSMGLGEKRGHKWGGWGEVGKNLR